MTPAQLKVIGAAVAVLILMSLAFAAAWFWQANSYSAELARQKSGFDADLAKISAAGAAQARTALEKQQMADLKVAELDTQLTKEKTDALAETERLRRAVADGDRRLRIAASCSAGGGNMPKADSAAGVDDGGIPRLDPAAERNYFDLRAGILSERAKVKALQAYVRDVCLGG